MAIESGISTTATLHNTIGAVHRAADLVKGIGKKTVAGRGKPGRT